jgi:hypothetical protein
MSWKDARELVHIRFELRRLVAFGDRETAATLLERMEALAGLDPTEHASFAPEIARWRFSFGLGA